VLFYDGKETERELCVDMEKASINPREPQFDLRAVIPAEEREREEGGEQTETNEWMTPPDFEDCDDATMAVMSMGVEADALHNALSSREKTMQLAYLHGELEAKGYFDQSFHHATPGAREKDKSASCACLVM